MTDKIGDRVVFTMIAVIVISYLVLAIWLLRF